MAEKAFENAETGKLIVSAVLLCADPTGAGATLLGFDGAILARDTFFKRQPPLNALAEELQADFSKKLRSPAYNKPKYARAVLPDMLKTALAEHSIMIQHDLNADDILATVLKTFETATAVPECRMPEYQTAFAELYLPLLERACIDPRLVSAVGPRIWQDHRKEQKRLENNQKAFQIDLGKVRKKFFEISDTFTESSSAKTVEIQKKRDADFAILMSQISASQYNPADIARLLDTMNRAEITIDTLIDLIAKQSK